MHDLPDKLYSVDSVVQLEQIAINQYGITAYELMKRAGAAVFDVIRNRYANKKILVLCGAGNNAGDGYVVARLAKEVGLDVRVISLIDPATLKNEASQAYMDWLTVGENSTADLSYLDESEIIVDALLGTGLTRPVSVEWAEWIEAVNGSVSPVVSVDIPSGLIADTGVISDSVAKSAVAIKADVTVCFIGLKQGMFTAQANDVCGDIVFSDLRLGAEIFSQVKYDACLLRDIDYTQLVKRESSSHKGRFGHVLIVGGNEGMPGAVILAARAALRTGAGLVTIITIPRHLTAISTAVPEAMIKTCATEENLTEDVPSIECLFKEKFISKITHVAVGMGIGQDDWSLKVFQHCMRLNVALLIDADALNLLAKHTDLVSLLSSSAPLVITPHPGEAARLLSSAHEHEVRADEVRTDDIQKDRFHAIKELHGLFHNLESCTVVLKGSGTLIFDGETVKVCGLGNAAMAAPGMGDVLSGILIALMAQNVEVAIRNVSDIAELAVCLHAKTADSIIGDRTRGLLASDVIDALPKVLQ